MMKYHGGTGGRQFRNSSLDQPLPTIDTSNRHAFISIYHGNGDNTHNLDGPAPTITAADIHAAVFINRDFSSATSSSINDPAGSITTIPKLNLVHTEYMVDSTQYRNVPTSIDEPATTITANHKYPYLITLQWGGQMRDVDRPTPTLLATADKTPVYLVMTETGQKAIRIFDDDIEIVKKIKVFMALYGITNIKMRMLRVDELLKIQGFPDDYLLMGSQTDQKKFIGNSVVPNVVKAWALAMGNDLVKTNAA
jgi:DNA (cytosine-5)-methyltransferase 1